MTVQSKNNNLNYLIDDPAFTNVNRLFVLSFTRTNAGDNRDSFADYYVSNVEIKDFNILIDRKSLLDFAYFKENYKLIAINLSKQTKLKDLQQTKFIAKLENQDHGATKFFIVQKSEETTFNFSRNSVKIL